MRKLIRSRKFLAGVACAALVAGLAVVPVIPVGGGAALAQGGGDVMVPKFEVDPFWPKPLPNHWVLAMTIGLSMDAKDNVWIVHRPQTLEQKELMPPATKPTAAPQPRTCWRLTLPET